MWPMFVDYNDDECKRLLRSLELEAYSAIISAFRAQGCLTKDKRKILQDLCSTLCISVERHRAEIRRAVNDEHLNTVAERLFGANTSTEWAIEGRRVVPLMQRLAPQTVFTDIANSAANAQATKNASLPLPGKTGLREISNGVETMASRKRKELPPDPYVSPNKLQAMDAQILSVVTTTCDTPVSQPVETVTTILDLTESPTSIDSSDDHSLPEFITTKITQTTNAPSVASPSKTSSMDVTLKPSTVTTFSSFDQITANLLSRKPARNPLTNLGLGLEGTQTSITEALKCLEPKNLQRSSSTGAMRTTVIPHTVVSTGTISSTSTTPTTTQSKFVNQLRSKSSVQGRQNLPSGLGVKLNIQPQMSRSVSPKSSGNKLKPETPGSNFLPKKSTTPIFSPTTTQSDSPQPTVNESLTITKTPPSVSMSKSPAKPESPVVGGQPSASKVPVTKSLPKVSTSSSQYISRSLFGTGTKGAKSLPPVIFNVSSSATLQTATKTTAPVQSEAGKTSSTQLLPKSTAIGVSQSHMKLGGSTTQTIQYRNDGGLVRSARIINVTPPAGSRLPCSITPSAISALGLSSNLTSGALRVTLPAGTLNSNSMRASAVAKPNVIVVHKAQMWPRSQGAAVIMSSSPVQRIPDNAQPENAAQKQEKSKSSITTTAVSSVSTTLTTKLSSKPHPSPRAQSPIVSSSTSIKVTDSSIRTPSPHPDHSKDVLANNKTTPQSGPKQQITPSSKILTSGTGNKIQSSATTTSQKLIENTPETQSGKSWFADVIELSPEPSEKPSGNEKEITKKESDLKTTQKLSSSNENVTKLTLDSTIAKNSTSFSKALAAKIADSSSTESSLSNLSDLKDAQYLKILDDKMESTERVIPIIPISSVEIPSRTVSKKQEIKDKNT